MLRPVASTPSFKLRRRRFRLFVVGVEDVVRRLLRLRRLRRQPSRRCQRRHLDHRVRAKVDGDGHLEEKARKFKHRHVLSTGLS